ncbi:MAG: PAS domain-containing protein, partial [Blastocatellia bacterium]|nr:PAS domain-containing protein [Blastocatellia bacterium]
ILHPSSFPSPAPMVSIMDLMKDISNKETARQEHHFDVLDLLEAVGFKSMRMKMFAGGMIYTAVSIGLICLAVNRELLTAADSAAPISQVLEQLGKSTVLSGLVIFAFLGLVVFLLSGNISRSLESALSQNSSGSPDPVSSEASAASLPLPLSQEVSDTPYESHEAIESEDHSECERRIEESRESLALLTRLRVVNSIINSLPQAVFCKDPEGRFTFANKAFCAGIGSPLDRILGKTDFDLFPAELAADYKEDDRRAVETAQVLERVIEHTDLSGEKLYTKTLRMPLYDEGGEIAGTQGISWDITERKLIEEALLRERDLLTALMDSSSDTIYFKDLESRFIRINKAQSDRFKLDDPADAIGKSDFDYFTDEHAQQAFDDEQRIIKTAKSLVGIEEKETWADRDDTWCSTTKNPLYDREGRIIGTFGITRDITERKRAAQARELDLAEFQAFASRVSEGDLTLRCKESDDTLGLAAQSVNRMLDNFGAMLKEVKRLGLLVSSSASQILVAAEEIDSGTQQQNQEISNTTASVEEMAVSMGQVSKNAEASTVAARQALSTAEKGGQSVRDTFEAMARIDHSVEQTTDKMQTLAQRSSEVSEVIDFINEIAAQTNLLAVNAAIQAVRAGEAGVGFSVLAEEIRKLAEKTARATKNVGGLIKSIQSETAEALSAMERGRDEVKTGSILAEQSRQSLDDTSEAVKESAQLIEEISAASEEQARITRDLAVAMQTISNITMEASTGAHETAQIIHAMAGLAESLNQSISQFHVEDKDA